MDLDYVPKPILGLVVLFFDPPPSTGGAHRSRNDIRPINGGARILTFRNLPFSWFMYEFMRSLHR